MNLRLDFDGVPILLRPAGLDDHPFIVDSWVMSYRNQARARDAGRAYLRGHKRAVRECLKRAAVRVACLEEKPAVIVGYAVLEQGDVPVIHWVFVKQNFRGKGIAHALLDDEKDRTDIVFTHKSWRPVTQTGALYDPYPFFLGPEPTT